jgi:hypothetical protein
MTDLHVDLDHLTTLSVRWDGLCLRLGDTVLPDAAVGVEPVASAWSGFRQRARDALARLAADAGDAAEGVAATRDAYAAAEDAITGMLR